MKKRTLLTCGLAAALFAGCSSDDKLTVDDGTVSNGGSGSGYLALNVSLPTTGNAPRAIADDQRDDKYNQGAPNEYAVNSIHLVCYDGSGNALQAFQYTGDAWSTPSASATGITTESVLKVQPVKSGVEQILVLVNAPAGLTFETDGDKLTGEMTYNSTTVSTYDEFKNFKFTDDVTGGGSKFYMSNSPLSNGTALTELVQVDPKNTMEEAMADVRTVNVERATGKVSLAHKANKQPTDVGYPEGWTDWEYQLGASGYVKDKVTFQSWMLDITNTVTYPVRHYNIAWEKADLEGKNGQRFRGTTTYKGNGNAAYNRTYWAEDPNYGALYTYSEADFTSIKTNTYSGQNLANALYCKENTFTVQNMEQRQSTRVLLQAKYLPFKNDSWAPESDGTWYRLGNSNTPYNAGEINALINNISGCSGVTIKSTLAATPARVFTADDFDHLTDAVNQVNAINKTLGTITIFAEGICYYVARIQHFGSYYTPWGAEPDGDATGFDQYINYTKQSDSDALNKAFLGRYGIVRNNWYELELGKVSAPGEPTVPNIPTGTNNSDDELNYYIQANIKIMDWAVRKQSVNL